MPQLFINPIFMDQQVRAREFKSFKISNTTPKSTLSSFPRSQTQVSIFPRLMSLFKFLLMVDQEDRRLRDSEEFFELKKELWQKSLMLSFILWCPRFDT